MGLYQAQFFKIGHLELGFLTYLLENVPKGVVLTMVNTLGSSSAFVHFTFPHLAHLEVKKLYRSDFVRLVPLMLGLILGG